MGLFLASLLSMAGLAVFFAAVLAVADKKLRVEEDPMITRVNSLLPGVNCGACGALSCHDFAERVIKEGEDPGKCRVIGEEAREELYRLTGAEEADEAPVVALVNCAAEREHKPASADYNGIQTCSAANLVFGAGMECQYGCMGFGDCVKVCPFDAIHMEKGLPRVDYDKCTGCGKCAEACPRGIIAMQKAEYDQLFHVACSSKDPLLRVRKICPVGCIACGVCEKLSEEKYFTVKDNLSYPDYSKQGDPEKIRPLAAKCPTKVIKEIQ
ncbi:MAG: RnfABCDGE type electron transport complex subunit B [Candidatus Omnitrophica bacterium]|nr:RnfABCDGE type electron transport complex subunit B [Candidatus Omnitrophota bacterium]